MTSLCAGDGALSDELWFLRGGLAVVAIVVVGGGGSGLLEPLVAVLLLVLYRTVVALLWVVAGLRVVVVTAGEVGIKPEWM